MKTDLSTPVRAALLGLAVGDALGVPVEFRSRDERRRDPVTGMRGFGTHHQPAGTWSDDSSLTFCLAETLAQPNGRSAPPDLADFARRAINWLDNAYWTATHRTFDVGGATRAAIGHLKRGIAPAEAGPRSEFDNGNGALMRILPLVFHDTWQADALDLEAAWALTRAVAGVTHGHLRSTLGCFLYLMMARELLAGNAPAAAYVTMRETATPWLKARSVPAAAEVARYEIVLNGQLPGLTERHIHSSGYVVHTIEAALWCLLNHDSYAATVLAAANLGDDTDTTAAVAGGLAGLAYGEAAIPPEWLQTLARRADIENLAEHLAHQPRSGASVPSDESV